MYCTVKFVKTTHFILLQMRSALLMEDGHMAYFCQHNITLWSKIYIKMIKEYGISVTTRIIVDYKACSCQWTRETPKREKSYASSIVFM